MKKIYLLFLFISNILFSQIGINTSNINPSAILQIDSYNKGVLFPQVSLQSIEDITTIPNPKNGLIVFNVNENHSIKKEIVNGVEKEIDLSVYKDLFYIYNGTKWQTLMSDVNGILTVNLPKIIARGRRTVATLGCSNENYFNLDTRDSNMTSNGQITASKTGYYKYYMSMNVTIKPNSYNPVIAYRIAATNNNSLTFIFKDINGTGNLTDYDITYSGVTYLTSGQLSGTFLWSLGGSGGCINNGEKQNSQEVIWEYLGESL